MGATVWQREGQGGKSYTTGVQGGPSATGKRKLVWRREDHQVPGSASAAPASTSRQRQGTAPASASAPAAPPSPAPQQPSFKRSRTEPQQQRSTAVHPDSEPAGGGAFSATPQSPETWDGEVDFDIPAAKSPAASSMPSACTPRVIKPPHKQGAAVRGEGYQQHAGSRAARMHAGLHAAGQNGNGFAYSGMAAQRPGAHAANGHARDPPAQHGGSRFPGASEEGPAAYDQKLATEQKLHAAQAELEALKASIAGRQAKLGREEREAQARAEFERRQREDLAKRRSRLEAGFAEAFKAAKQPDTTKARSSAAAAMAAADLKEVTRVLKARYKTGCTYEGAGTVTTYECVELRELRLSTDDYEVLCLRPGASAADVRKRYKDMAVSLHPDKCSAPKATDAFQRLVHAYQKLLKLVA